MTVIAVLDIITQSANKSAQLPLQLPVKHLHIRACRKRLYITAMNALAQHDKRL